MEFNWEKFKDKNNKIAVHCRTEAEAKDFCREMHEHGMKWYSGRSYLDEINWFEYKMDTCYSNIRGFSDIDFYKNNNYIILEWSDYMQKEDKNYMEQIAEMLDVEIEQEFEIIDEAGEIFDDGPFVLKEEGLFDRIGRWHDTLLISLLNGNATIKKQWKPKKHDLYYVPSFSTANLCRLLRWNDDYIDNHCYKNNTVCKTKEEAIILTKKMLEVIK